MAAASAPKRPGSAASAAARPARGRRAAAAAKLPAGWGEALWQKIAIYSAAAAAPFTAMLLLGFVLQMSAALRQLDSPAANITANAAAPAAAAEGSRLAFIQPPAKAASAGAAPNAAGHSAAPSAARPAGRDARLRAFSDKLRFVHHGLIYSSFAVLAAGAGCFMLLLYFIWRDKRYGRAYQTLLTGRDHIIELRLRHRTARLEAARHLAEKERRRAELLLQDSSHRIGNSLATVSALLGLQLRQCADPAVRRALLSARDRVQAISAAHRRLRLNQDMETASAGEFLAAVIQDVENGLSTGQRRQIQIETHFEHWYLPARDVTTLGIILGELLTNAVKHAFPAGRPGQIYVAFGKMRAKNLRLIVEDDGIGLPAELQQERRQNAAAASTAGAAANSAAGQQAQGLGRLILSQLAAQFDSAPQYSRGRRGGCRVIIPLLNVKAAAASPAANRQKAA